MDCTGLAFGVLGELCVPALDAGFFPVLFTDPGVTFVFPVLETGFFPAAEAGLTPGFPWAVFRVVVALADGAVLDPAGRPTFLAGGGPGLIALFSIKGACTAFTGAFIFLVVPPLDDFDLLVLGVEDGFLDETAFVTNAALATLVLRTFG